MVRPTEAPNLRVGTPKTEVLVGIVLRLAPKTAAEVSYNPPSHSLSDLPGRPPPAQIPHQRKVTEITFQIVRPWFEINERYPARLDLGLQATPTLS